MTEPVLNSVVEGACCRCGDCCRNNGLIPPLVDDPDAPEWLSELVTHLRKHLGHLSESGCACMFLGTDAVGESTCLLHAHGLYKPAVCREFLCEMQGGEGET